MDSYFKNILLSRIIGLLGCFIAFFVCMKYVYSSGNPDALASAIGIITSMESLDFWYSSNVWSSWGGKYGLESTIYYMKNLITLYFLIIYVSECIWKENRELAMTKLVVAVILFRTIIIPNSIPLSLIICVFIFTILANGIVYAIKKLDINID